MVIDQFPEAKCLQCGFHWIRRVPKPSKCPVCQRRDWEKPSKKRTSMSEPKDEFDALRHRIEQ